MPPDYAVMPGTEDVTYSRRERDAGLVLAPIAGGCSEGGQCDPELSADCQPPDYHCSKCGRYMGPA